MHFPLNLRILLLGDATGIVFSNRWYIEWWCGRDAFTHNYYNVVTAGVAQELSTHLYSQPVCLCSYYVSHSYDS